MPRDPRAGRRQPHIVHVVFDFHGGGMESLVCDLARRFAGRASVSVISLSGRIGRAGGAILPLLDQLHVLQPIPGWSMLAPLGLTRRLRELRPDAVHLHSGAWFKGALAARLAGVPVIVFTEHGREHNDPRSQRQLDRSAALLTDAVVAVSPRLHWYLHNAIGVPERKLHTIVNGVDVAGLSATVPDDGLRARLGIPPGAPVIGSVGRFQPVKAYDVLISAFAAMRAGGGRAAEAHLVLCGDGPELPALKRLTGELGLDAVIHFAGWIDQPAPYYRMFDVFTLTSTSEGAPVSLMEAMVCGALPVVTEVGANAEILGPDLADRLVTPGDIPGISRALGDALTSPRVAELRRIAFRRIETDYNLDRLVGEYERLYRGERIGATVKASRAVSLSRPREHLQS